MSAPDDTSSTLAPRPASFEVASRESCLALLASTTVGRIAFVGAEGVVLLPVNYRIIDASVVLRVSAGGTLAQLAEVGGDVVFEVDYHSPTSRTGWSVIVRGQVSGSAAEGRFDADELARVVPWVPQDGPSIVLELSMDQLTGRTV